MKDQITIYSRSNNDFLFERMKSFIPECYNVLKCDQFNDWKHAADYLYHIIDTCPTKWAINIDIDCFVFDWAQVLRQVEHMEKFGSICFGMPDSINYHPYRYHSRHAMNPFFNIFNVEEIREIKESDGFTWQEIGFTTLGKRNGEPFHGLFQWLKISRPSVEMKTVTKEDHTTTLGIASNGAEFLLHTWYSRYYGGTSEESIYHTERIDRWYEEALRLKK